jgi:hypothetical protein
MDSSVTRPNLGLTSGWADHDVYGTKANANFDMLDALVQCAVLDKDLSTPPASPNDGDRYIVKATGSGVWTGHDNAIAVWLDDPGEWRFHLPTSNDRWIVLVVDETNKLYFWNGTAWEAFATGGGGVGGGGSGTGKLLIIPADFEGGDDTPTTRGGTDGLVQILPMSGAGDRYDPTSFLVPTDFASVVSWKIFYVNESTSSSTVEFQLGLKGLADGTDAAASVTFGSTLTTTPPTTTNQEKEDTLPTPAVTMAAGERWKLVLRRNGAADANNDTMGVTGILLTYNRA